MAEGLHVTHWTSEDLPNQAVVDGIVPSISARTVRRILNFLIVHNGRMEAMCIKTADGLHNMRESGSEKSLILAQAA